MKIIEINSRYYNVPETWNELSCAQLLQVMALLNKKEYPIEKALLKLLKILTGMSWWQFLRAPITTTSRYHFKAKNFRLSFGEFLYLSKVECTGLEEYLYLSEFLINANDLTKNILPAYKGFAGPADECGNLKMHEFVFTDHIYMHWVETKESDDLLNNLVAVLYRPQRRFYNKKKNKAGDRRIEFNDNLCAYYAKKDIAGWPAAVKLAIVHFYEACRNKWIADNPDVFGGAGGEPAQFGLLSVMRGVAKSGVHGDFEKVEHKHVSLILMELNELVAEAREHEKAMKR